MPDTSRTSNENLELTQRQIDNEARAPPTTYLRPTTLATSVRARQQQSLRKRRRALEKKLRNLEALLRIRAQQQTDLTQEVELADSRRRDETMRLRHLRDTISRNATRSLAEQETQTELGQRYLEARRLHSEYLVNRPYDNEGIVRLEAEYTPLQRTMIDNTQAILAPLREEIDLAQTNYYEANHRYLSLNGQLIDHSLLTHNLTNIRDDLVRQSNELNIELGRGPRIRQRRTIRHKKSKRTRKRRH